MAAAPKAFRKMQDFNGLNITDTVIERFGATIIPKDLKQPDWELELGVVIGKRTRRVSQAEAMECVAGYFVMNNMTSRDLVYRPDIPQMGMDWLSSKCSPADFPIGPSLVPAEFIKDSHDLTITSKLNGERMVHEKTNSMIFLIERLIKFVSMTVEMQPGDDLAAGSSPGNGMAYGRFLRPDDGVEGGITLLGTHRNLCVEGD